MSTLTATSYNERLGALPFLKRFFVREMSGMVPKKAKRLIFVISILALIENSKTLNKELTHKLNAILQLAYDEEALKFPAYLKEWIWKNRIKDRMIEINGVKFDISDNAAIIQHDPKCVMLSKSILSIMPLWLMYASSEEMTHDIRMLFTMLHR
jgi:uncharacterized Fe-S cluster protein YjdI